MTTPRTTRILRAMLAIALAATVALPAATALQLAGAGDAALGTAWNSAGSLGGGGYSCMSTDCGKATYGGALGNEGRVDAKAGWSLAAQADEQAAIDAAASAVDQVKAEAEAKVREASELKERVRADVRADSNVRTRGGADALLDSDATLGGTLGLEGLLAVNGDKKVDVQQEKRMKQQVEAKATAQAESALGMIESFLAQLQGQVTMAFDSAIHVAADAGGAVAGALGLVDNTKVDVRHSLDATASLGSVPSIEVPRIAAPEAGLSGSGNLAAQVAGTASGVIRG